MLSPRNILQNFDMPFEQSKFLTVVANFRVNNQQYLSNLCRFLSIHSPYPMFDAMNIKLPTEKVLELFEFFDADGGGSIDAIEFIRQVFPKAGSRGFTDNTYISYM